MRYDPDLLLMHKLQYTIVDKWAETLETVPLYAALGGFDRDSTPGVGTIYDFSNRLWIASSPHLMKKNQFIGLNNQAEKTIMKFI